MQCLGGFWLIIIMIGSIMFVLFFKLF
jgi:hypothetical protein